MVSWMLQRHGRTPGSTSVTQADMDAGTTLHNVVTADSDESAADTAVDDVTITQNPAIDIRKNADGADTQTVIAGDVVTFTITVINAGNVTLTNVEVTDLLVPGCATVIGTLAPGASSIYTCTMTASVDMTNIAVVTGTPPIGDDVTEEDPSSVDVITPGLYIQKNAHGDDTQYARMGETVTFTIYVQNTGNVPMTNVVVADPLVADCNQVIGTLLPGATYSYTCTTTYSVDFTNIATVTGETPAGLVMTDEDPSTVLVLPEADLSLVKIVDNITPGVGTNVTFTIIVTNSGPHDATNVSVRDVLPSGLIYVSSSPVGVYDDATGVWTIGTIQAPPDPNTTTLTITATVYIAGEYTNIAEVITSEEFDPDSEVDNQEPLEDDQDEVNLEPVQGDPENLVKSIYGTNQEFTADNYVAIGEIVTYTVTTVVPPGRFPSMRLTDTMDRGLAYVSCYEITESGPGLVTSSGTLSSVCDSAVATTYLPGSTDPRDDGRQVVFDFGTLDNPTPNDITLTITYYVVVLNSSGNVNGLHLNNSAQWTWGQNDEVGPVNAPDVIIVEPRLNVTKTATPTLITVGTEVTFTLTLEHDPTFSTTEAFGVVLDDPLSIDLDNVVIVDCNSGAQDPDTCSYSGATHTIHAEWSSFTRSGGDAIIIFRATVATIPASNEIHNIVTGEWTSLPDDVFEPQTDYNELSDERTFPPGDDMDNYIDTDEVVLQTATQPATGFAPNRVTTIDLPRANMYADLGDLTLEIPMLGINIPIVGVPLVESEWDLTWLWNKAGWLNETAYPTWNGNSVMTGHVYLPNGLPGPFLDLGKLEWGDQIIVHSNGSRFIYQVRAISTVKPDDMTAFKHEDKSWVTLVTCKEYDETTDTYKKRIVIRAVLVEVTNELGSGK